MKRLVWGALALGWSMLTPAVGWCDSSEKPDYRSQNYNAAASAVWGLKPFGEKSACFSPLSLWFTLGLAEAGAQGQTASEFHRFFHLESGSYRKSLVEIQQQVRLAGKKGAFRSACAAWVPPGNKKGSGIASAYSQRVKTLGGQIRTINFQDPAGAARQINRWADQSTDGKVKMVVTPGDLAGAELVLTNALRLKAMWARPFDPKLTRPRPFAGRDVPTMRRSDSYPCLIGERGEAGDFSVVELEYGGLNWAMDIVLPSSDEPLALLEKRLSEDTLRRTLEKLEARNLELTLPKFHIHSKAELKDPLIQLGLKLPFSSTANFAGFFTAPESARGLHISRIVQEVDLEVSERGTEAGAVTTAVMTRSMPIPFHVDRPFLFVIRDRTSGVWVFVGRYTGNEANKK